MLGNPRLHHQHFKLGHHSPTSDQHQTFGIIRPSFFLSLAGLAATANSGLGGLGKILSQFVGTAPHGRAMPKREVHHRAKGASATKLFELWGVCWIPPQQDFKQVAASPAFPVGPLQYKHFGMPACIVAIHWAPTERLAWDFTRASKRFQKSPLKHKG